MNKLGVSGWIILTIGAIGTLAAVILELLANEPVYLLVMKITALCFGVGGAIIGVSVARIRKT